MKIYRISSFLSLAIIAVTALLIVSSCKFSKYKRSYSRPDTLCIDSATYSRVDSMQGRKIMVKIRADYPTPITSKLSANIAAWVRGNLGKGIPVDTMDAQKVVDYFGDAKFDSYVNSAILSPNAYYDAECRMESNRRNYVSFKFTLDECAGETDGVTSISGITLRKSDGVAFGWNMLKDTTSKGFRNVLREGVRSYLKETLGENEVSDENLCSLLVYEREKNLANYNPLESFPIPKTPPYLSHNGMTFVFQPYEIAPYSLGTPVFTIPFSDIKCYMTAEALRLIKKSKQ